VKGLTRWGLALVIALGLLCSFVALPLFLGRESKEVSALIADFDRHEKAARQVLQKAKDRAENEGLELSAAVLLSKAHELEKRAAELAGEGNSAQAWALRARVSRCKELREDLSKVASGLLEAEQGKPE
jgi:hypothetical protein